jgi:hypothetical protein
MGGEHVHLGRSENDFFGTSIPSNSASGGGGKNKNFVISSQNGVKKQATVFKKMK